MKEQRLARVQKTGSSPLLAALRTEKKDASCQRRRAQITKSKAKRRKAQTVALSCDARRYKDAKTEIYARTAARLSLAGVQLVECALQLFKLLSSLAELAFRCQALVVGEILGGFRDEGVEVGCGPGRCVGRRCVSRQLRGNWGSAQ